MLHLPGGFFHFDFEVCPPPPSQTMPETTKNFFQHCDKQAKCRSLRTCWGYTTLFRGASKGRDISKYGGKNGGCNNWEILGCYLYQHLNSRICICCWWTCFSSSCFPIFTRQIQSVNKVNKISLPVALLIFCTNRNRNQESKIST